MTTTSRGPSRRTLVKGAAWSVPVVAVAGAAPAMAASQIVTITGTGAACKSPGGSCDKDPWNINKGYFVSVEVCTNVRDDIIVTFGDATVLLNGQPAGNNWSVEPNPLTIAGPTDPGDTSTRCSTIVLGVAGEPSSQNVSIEGSAPFSWVSQDGVLQGNGTLTFSAAATPPCPDCGVVPPPGTASTVAETDVKLDEAPASSDVKVDQATTDDAPAPAPAAPVEPAPAPAPADDASATSAP